MCDDFDIGTVCCGYKGTDTIYTDKGEFCGNMCYEALYPSKIWKCTKCFTNCDYDLKIYNCETCEYYEPLVKAAKDEPDNV
jgi:hypothetical protein